eukprot:4660397-Alexandrium_andersonii.AAC.1
MCIRDRLRVVDERPSIGHLPSVHGISDDGRRAQEGRRAERVGAHQGRRQSKATALRGAAELPLHGQRRG